MDHFNANTFGAFSVRPFVVPVCPHCLFVLPLYCALPFVAVAAAATAAAAVGACGCVSPFLDLPECVVPFYLYLSCAFHIIFYIWRRCLGRRCLGRKCLGRKCLWWRCLMAINNYPQLIAIIIVSTAFALRFEDIPGSTLIVGQGILNGSQI